MANTERVKTLQVVHALKMLVSEKRRQYNFQNETIEYLFFQLEALEDKLIVADICKNANELIAAAQGLEEVVKEGNQSIAEIKDLIALIKKSANAVKYLVQLAQIAADIAT